MAIKKMNESIHGNTREYKETLSLVTGDGLVTGDSVVLPDNLMDLSIAVFPGASATAKVQFSVSPQDEVLAGNANWVDWESGDVTAATLYHAQGPITAFRLVASTNSATAEDTTIEATGNELV